MSTMQDWIDAAKAELGVDVDVDVAELLETTKVVAHNVTRPTAPLAAFLVGCAAAQAGGGPAAVTAACRTVTHLAECHTAEST
jgi:hypothetical protein